MENVTTLDSIADDLLTTVPLLHRIVRRNLIREAFAAVNPRLSPPHFAVMKAISESEPLNMTQLTEELLVSRPQATILVDRLVSEGLVERQANPKDRRTVNVTLSKSGHEALRLLQVSIAHAIKASMSDLAKHELDALAEALNVMRRVLSKLK